MFRGLRRGHRDLGQQLAGWRQPVRRYGRPGLPASQGWPGRLASGLAAFGPGRDARSAARRRAGRRREPALPAVRRPAGDGRGLPGARGGRPGAGAGAGVASQGDLTARPAGAPPGAAAPGRAGATASSSISFGLAASKATRARGRNAPGRSVSSAAWRARRAKNSLIARPSRGRSGGVGAQGPGCPPPASPYALASTWTSRRIRHRPRLHLAPEEGGHVEGHLHASPAGGHGDLQPPGAGSARAAILPPLLGRQLRAGRCASPPPAPDTAEHTFPSGRGAPASRSVAIGAVGQVRAVRRAHRTSRPHGQPPSGGVRRGRAGGAVGAGLELLAAVGTVAGRPRP